MKAQFVLILSLGFDKATDFNGAIAEMNHFGLAPAVPFTVAVIVRRLGASASILTGFLRGMSSWTRAFKTVR